MKVVLALLALASVAYAQEEKACPTVSPIRNFQYPGFEGRWYEIGHYRNRGPMIWAEDNYCSTVNVTKDFSGENDGDSILSYNANLYEPDGFLQWFETSLLDMRPPGQWKQQVIPNPIYELHTFTVLEMSSTEALVYRCGRYDDELSYTVQILSRKNTIDASTEENYKQKVAELKLNFENAEYRKVPHADCTYDDH